MSNGGEIRLYDSLLEPHYCDIAPVGNRLVLFWSDLIVHEVLPSWSQDQHAHRYTFTMWLSAENFKTIADATDPLYPLREAHYPTAPS